MIRMIYVYTWGRLFNRQFTEQKKDANLYIQPQLFAYSNCYFLQNHRKIEF